MKIAYGRLCLLILSGALTMPPAWAGTEGASSTFYGQGAGNSATSSGGQNLFLGYQAGYQNNGDHNTFVGFQAGYASSLSLQNTFVGNTAGYSNTSGAGNNFIGYQAGVNNTTGSANDFLGVGAGYSNGSGGENLFLGYATGAANLSGSKNTYVGRAAGNGATGSANVFLGYKAGLTEAGSNRLYIDNCYVGGTCQAPLIYGEFDNHVLRFDGALNVAADGASKSQLHFSLDNGDYGGFLTSVLQNNFFMSSGARWDNSAGGWIQRSSDQQSVIQGSGTLGFRIFTSSGHAVGTTFAPTTRLLIDYNGQFALNANATVAGHEIHTSSGAYLTSSGTWTNASSREYKDNIRSLSTEAAVRTLDALDPVTFTYKNDAQQRVGFIAEDVPEMVAMPDRKGLSPMDIVAVLTKVVQEQRQQLEAERSSRQRAEEELQRRLQQLAAEVAQMQARVPQ
jgi:hypothetical protein